jgi:type IV pilus assembly protein PilA
VTAPAGPCFAARTLIASPQGGFTLIEMMIIVAIVAILASIAIPAYSVYSIRARVSEGMVISDNCRNAISEIYQAGGLSNVGFRPDGWGCNEGAQSPSRYVQVIHTDARGAIYVTMDPNDAGLGGARGRDIIFRPVIVSGGNFSAQSPSNAPSGQLRGWTCTPGPTMPAEYLPSSCR